MKDGRFLGGMETKRNPRLPILVQQLERVDSAGESIGGNGGTYSEGRRKIAKVVVCQNCKFPYRFIRAVNIRAQTSVKRRYCNGERYRNKQAQKDGTHSAKGCQIVLGILQSYSYLRCL